MNQSIDPQVVEGAPSGLARDEAATLLRAFPCCFLYNKGEQHRDKDGQLVESLGKDPVGGGWQKKPRRPEEWRGRGIGVICGPMPGFDGPPVYALDFDVIYQAPAQAVRQWFAKWLSDNGKQGETLDRVGKAPKFLVPFLLEDDGEPLRKINSAKFYPPDVEKPLDEEKNQLEILGAGNQFVAYHVHPDTGQPYQWDTFAGRGFLGQLHLTDPSDLLRLTRADLDEICESFERIMAESGLESAQEIRERNRKPSAQGKHRAAQAPSDGQWRSHTGHTLEELLAYIPNDGGTDYDEWLVVLAAIHDVSGPGGEHTARQWSASNAGKHDDAEFEKTWASFGNYSGARASAGTLVTKAIRGGMPRPQAAAKTPEQVAAELDAIVIEEPERPGAFPIPKSCRESFIVRMGLDMARVTEMPEATAVITALGAFSGIASMAFCTGYKDGSRLPLGLYTVAEQPPATAKSRLLNSFATPWLRAVKAYNAERMEEAKAESEQDEGKDEGSKPKKPRLLPLPFSNATPEAMEQAMTQDDTGHFWLQSAEQGAIRMLFGDGVKDRPKNFDLALKGFNGEFHSSARVVRQKLLKQVYGGITVLAQAGSIRTILSNSDGDGLAERFLYVAEPHNLGRRTHNAGPPDAFLRADFQCALAAVLRHYQTIPEDNRGELDDLHYLGFSDTGHELINQHRIRIEPQLAQHADNGEMVMTALLGKSDMQAMKVAAVMYLSDCLSEGKPYAARIPDEYLKAGLELALTLLKHIEAVLVNMERIGPEAARDAIRRQFERRPERTVREITQAVKKVKPFRDNPSPIAYAKRIITGMVNRGELLQVGNKLQLG